MLPTNQCEAGRFSIYTSVSCTSFRRGRVKNQPSKRSTIVTDGVKEHKITSWKFLHAYWGERSDTTASCSQDSQDREKSYSSLHQYTNMYLIFLNSYNKLKPLSFDVIY